LEKNRINTVVIGTGYWGTKICEKIKGMDKANLVGVVDKSHQIAKKVGERLGCDYGTDIKDIKKNVDAVIVAVPAVEHFPVAKGVLELGLHTFVEKPLACGFKPAEYLVNIAEKKGLVLQVGHLERYNPLFLETKKIIKDPLFIETERLSPFNARSLDVDVIFDIMIHDIDLVETLLNDNEVVSLDSIGGKILTDKIDIAKARLKFMNGTEAELKASRVSFEKVRKIRVFSEGIYLSMNLIDFTMKIVEKKNGTLSVKNTSFEKKDLLGCELLDFFRKINGEDIQIVSGYKVLAAVSIAERVFKSIRSI